MTNKQLLDYIKHQLQQGTGQEQIKNSLMANGWQENDIDEAFAILENGPASFSQQSVPRPNLTSLPGAIATLGQAWALYKRRLVTFLGIMAIPILALTAFIALFFASGLPGFMPDSPVLTAGGILFLVILVIVFFLVILVSQLWGQTALLYAIRDSQEGIGVVEAYRRGWRKILSYWWVSVLVGFITMGGFLLFFVPGIIFAVWFSLAMFVLISEDLKGMNALLKSREYVKGNWGKVLWRFLFIGVLSFIIALVLFLNLTFLKIPFGGEIGQLAIGLFLTPFATTYTFLMYNNLKALKGEFVFAPTGGRKTKFIIVGIIGFLFIPVVLLSIIFTGFDSVKEGVRDARREADIRQIQHGLEFYYYQNRSYPLSLNELPPQYLPAVPADPKTGLPYHYQLTGDADYQLCAELESRAQKCVTPQF